MYDIIKSVINSGRYDLSDMLKKIDTIWLQGNITDEQKDELVGFARDKAIPENSYEPLQQQIDDLATLVADINTRLKTLEGGEPEPSEEYPEYVQPTGAHDAYHKDDKVTYSSVKYICIAPDGVAVVWSPDEYPTYWQRVEE